MISQRTCNALEYGKILEQLAHYCVSPAGQVAARSLRPFAAIAPAQEAAQLFDACCTWYHSPVRDGVPFHMVAFPDVSGIEGYLQSASAVLDVDALWALREALTLASRACESINTAYGAEHWPQLCAVATQHPLPAESIAALVRCLSDDGFIKDESSPALLLVRGELRNLHQHCMRKVKDFANQYNITHYLQDSFMTLASDRYVLPLKANFKGRIQGIIHDWSQTGETCYFEPMFLVEINNRLQELKHQEREEEHKILEYLTGLIRQQLPDITAATALLTRLDVLLAQDKLAKAMHGACCATLTPDSGIHLLQARHPLLALTDKAQPVDIILDHKQHGLIISGGNAGGKTVCLKTLGLMTLMALTGLPVPAQKGSSLPAWTQLHAFIGDEQSLDDHVSTFTAQIEHLARAWEQADAHTLILLDEFGAGTDPSQGAALAQAVLDCLLERNVSVVAATHFPALKVYALTHPKARAASVLFDPDTKRPLFRLAYDQVGASQALDVAREHGLPEAILRRAEHYLLLDAGNDGGQNSNTLIARLNTLALEREKEIVQLQQKQQQYRQKREQLHERFEKERQKLHDEVRQKAHELMTAWKANKLTHKQALKDMSQLRATLVQEAAPATTPVDPAQISAGQRIMHNTFGKQGTVLEVDSRRQRVRIDLNGVTLWAAYKDISPLDAAIHNDTDRKHISVNVIAKNTPLLRLDLRGKRADMALHELEQFLDKALLDGREEVEIIHGRGTGVLRKQVHAYLHSLPNVAQALLAPEDRGGDGMTIVTLR